MINKLSHVSVFVLDQDRAHDFYVGKMGFEVRTDAKMDNGFRWLTVGPKDQPDLEIVLMPIKAGMALSEEQATKLRELVESGAMGAGVFTTNDIHGDYEALKRKGVQFKSPPTERFYGTEAIVKDDSGNWFSLTQPK